MAFVGAISDLFSCGKPRKPQAQESAIESRDAPAAARDVTAEPVPNIGLGAFAPLELSLETPWDKTTTTPPNDKDATPKPRQGETVTHDRNSDIPTRLPVPTKSSARPERENVLDEVAQDSSERHEQSIGDNKVENKAWLVEKRILVTGSPHEKSNARPETYSGSQHDATHPPLTATITTELKEVASSQHAFALEAESPRGIEHVAPAAAIIESKPEEAVASVARPADPVSATAPAPALVAPHAATVPVQPSQEEEEVVNNAIAPPQKTAPKQLLDLPTEVRNAIYERLAEAAPIRMCRHDDPALAEKETLSSKRQYYNLTKVSRQLRKEFLPVYERKTEYVIDLWAQRTHLADLNTLKGRVAMDIDAACFDMAPIDLLPLIRYLARTGRANCRFASTEGVVFRSIETIVDQLNKLLPSPTCAPNWLAAVNGPMKRIDLHLFPHEDVRNYYRFRGAEPMVRIVYPSAATEAWMKQSHKSGGEYEAYLAKTGLDALDMHVVVGHASRRTTNADRLPLDWRLSYVGSRLSLDQAVRISGTFAR